MRLRYRTPIKQGGRDVFASQSVSPMHGKDPHRRTEVPFGRMNPLVKAMAAIPAITQ